MIDILLPYYGDLAFLQEAVGSVLGQTSAEWTLVIVDDLCPAPGARDWLDQLKHPQVRVLHNEQTLGVNGNFRRSSALATSSHVMFLGCDDVLLPGYVEQVHAALDRHPKAALIQPRAGIIDEKGKPVSSLADTIKKVLAPPRGREHVLFGEQLAVSLLRGAWTYFPAICWRRDVLARHPFWPGLETALDLALLLDVVLDGETFVLLDSEAFMYRRHKQSASSQSAMDSRRFEEEDVVFRNVAPRLREVQWYQAERAARVHITSRLHALAQMLALAGRGNRNALMPYIRHALVP